ncbi:MAG: YraN family protein [Candidatus Omnitrophota bacterium]
MTAKNPLGQYGENLAESFLIANGYQILERNFRVKLGEIDIIARDGDTLCFVEVKTRRSEKAGSPFEAVSRFKQAKLAQVALIYINKNNLGRHKARFDVVAVTPGSGAGNENKVEIIRDAFNLDGMFYR